MFWRTQPDTNIDHFFISLEDSEVEEFDRNEKIHGRK